MMNRLIPGVLLVVFLASCARAPLKGPENAMRRTSAPELADDLPLEELIRSVKDEIAFLEKSVATGNFEFGSRAISKEDYVQGLRRFAELGSLLPDRKAFFEAVRRDFDFYEVYGDPKWGDVFITSYYEPLIEGSLKPTSRFTQPLYQTPEDLISVDLGLFDPKFSQERKYRGRMEGKKIVPYFSREDLDVKNALKGRRLELCWLDPIDAFFLQIQGSGTVRLENGKILRLNYAEKNGHVYEGISKFLKPYIPAERMNLHTIEAYLRTLPRDLAQKILNLNPSYVFFKLDERSALTYLGIPATDGRTIATDRRYFPKGALGFLSFEKPRFASTADLVPNGTEKTSRFVLDQDIGGAINGGGRVDLFWGRGHEAKLYAGAMKNPGKLYYLVPKN